MKRSSQEKVKSSPLKQDAAKLRDMQKAYGVLPKNATKSKVSSKSVKSTSGVSTEATVSNSQKSRSSLGPTLSSKPVDTSSLRKSFPPEPAKPKSKLVAASKANYAEKYGSVAAPAMSSLQKSRAGGTSKQPSGTNKKTKSINSSLVSTSNSPLKRQNAGAPTQKTSIVKSSNSTTSGLSSQKPPRAFYESETISEPATEDYDEDFEEDYESDFEEEMGSADESAQESEADGVNDIVTAPAKDTEVIGEIHEEEEYDKSSSIREFEKLEKMVAVEENHALGHDVKPTKSLDLGSVKINHFGDARGAGEPIGSINPKESDDEEEVEEEEEEDEEGPPNSLLQSSPDKRQNAFPTITGFSLNVSSSQQNTEKTLQQAPRGHSGVVANRNNFSPNKKQSDGVAKTTFKEVGTESISAKKKRVNRGQIIQGMIRLDRVSVDIFHLSPYQYDRFMAVFSGSDRLQASTQTDQDKSEESAQTEPIEQIAKWTQKPPTWSTTSSSCDVRIVRQEALGVGSDEITEDLSTDQKIHKQFDFLKNWEQLSKFITRASRKMLYVLEAEERIKLPSNAGNKGSLETIKMNRGLSVLNKLAMHTLAGDGEFVACANGESQSVHLQQQETKTTNGNKKHTSKNLVTVWSLKEPSMPLYFLRVWGHVSALKLQMIGRMVVSGNKDGSLNVWNLDEPLCYHSHYQDHAIRTPSVNTSCMMPNHVLPVIGIEMFPDSKNTFSIISIDKEGMIITWSCHRSSNTLNKNKSDHSSAWSTVHISVRNHVQLNTIIREHHIQVTCFMAWDTDTTWFMIGTFNGYVAKGQVLEMVSTVEKYHERLDSNPKVTCMDVSKVLNILVIGCEDGRCRLFEMTRRKLVLSLGGKQEPVRVKWSGRRASVLYVALKESLLIWDLLSSDMNPWKTIHLKDIQDFVLYSPPHKEYLVVITGNDLIISTSVDEVKPLSSRDFARIQSYFSLLC